MGGGDEVSDGAVGSRREGDTPCATRRVSTARAREKPGRRATSPAAGARSADPVDTARRQIRARASSDPSRRASRGFDRSRERHGRSADLTAPRRTYDGGAVVRHDRHGDRVSSRPVALRARVSNDAPPGLVLKTFHHTRKRFCPEVSFPRLWSVDWNTLSTRVFGGCVTPPRAAGETRWRPRRPSRPPTRASRAEPGSSVSRPAAPRRSASAERRGGAEKRRAPTRVSSIREADAFVRFARAIGDARSRRA